MPAPILYTIGHSNHPADRFAALLKAHGIRLLADIRSQPASRFLPQFNRAALAPMLEASGIAYRWLVDRLGGRPRDPAMYDADGHPDYAKMAATRAFRGGAWMNCLPPRRKCLPPSCAPSAIRRNAIVTNSLRRPCWPVAQLSGISSAMAR